MKNNTKVASTAVQTAVQAQYPIVVKPAVQALYPVVVKPPVIAANDLQYPIHYEFSPVANVYPMIPEAEFKLFVADIEANGLKTPIAVQDGMIVDGRHRYMACMSLGITPKFEILDSTVDAAKYSLSMNIHRRQLSNMDKIEIAQSLVSLPVGSNQHTAVAGRSQEDVAVLLGISVDTLQRGKHILGKGCPELQKEVREGRCSIAVGAEISKLTEKEQQKILKKNDEIETNRKAGKVMNVLKKQALHIKKTKEINDLIDQKLQLDGTTLYSVIYADPPWKYMGFLDTPYVTMPLEDICALNVQGICTNDAVLMMWAPSAMLPSALEVIKAWDFEYVTSAVWDKQTGGQGMYFRQQHEFLLIATRGQPPAVDPMKTPGSVIRGPRTGHSRKPHCVYGMIEAMYPGLAKVELFSRDTRDGWTMLGNQAGSMTEAITKAVIETVAEEQS